MGAWHSGVVHISHMFADDALVFCGANPHHLCYLCVEAVFGLKINLAKS
jgi:hypothetical protein